MLMRTKNLTRGFPTIFPFFEKKNNIHNYPKILKDTLFNCYPISAAKLQQIQRQLIHYSDMDHSITLKFEYFQFFQGF